MLNEAHFEKLREELSFLRDAGQKEYAHKEDDAFANFRRASTMFDGNVSMDQVLLVFALKHIDGIKAWFDGHKSQREDVSGRMNDVIVYLTLFYAMYHTGYKASRARVAEILDELLANTRGALALSDVAKRLYVTKSLSPFQRLGLAFENFASGNVTQERIFEAFVAAVKLRLEHMAVTDGV